MSSVAKNAKVREILGTFWNRVERRGDLYPGILDGGFFFFLGLNNMPAVHYQFCTTKSADLRLPGGTSSFMLLYQLD
jgi:hypothetical protein